MLLSYFNQYTKLKVRELNLGLSAQNISNATFADFSIHCTANKNNCHFVKDSKKDIYNPTIQVIFFVVVYFT